LLNQIKVPALGFYGDKDKVVNPHQWRPMKKGIPQSRIERFPTAGHFMMLEERALFSQKLKDFLDEPQPLS
jgi:pimeloyl-ACP methyl ester carboxylesterase